MKNKGMTLIELLVVIVLVAIIALIVVPIVGNTVEDVKKQAAVTNTDKLIRTVIDYYETKVMKNERFSGVVFECDGKNCFDELDTSNKLSFSGEVPKGHITITEYGEVKQADVIFGNYVCSMIDDKITCKKPDLIITDIDGFNSFLDNVQNYNSKLVALTSDLDYTGGTYTPSSDTFEGEFNGLGYDISNITYEGENFYGIFKSIDSAIVKSLNVKDSTFTITATSSQIGGIIGAAKKSSKIYNCSSTNIIIQNADSTKTMFSVGGIVGMLSESDVYGGVVNNVTIETPWNTTDGSGNSGGIVGQMNDSEVNNCYVFDSNIKSYWNGGGLAGGTTSSSIDNSYVEDTNLLVGGTSGGIVAVSNALSISNSYVSGCSIEGSGHIGGMIGRNDGGDTVVNNAYLKNIAFSTSTDNTGLLIGGIKEGTLSIKNSYALSIETKNDAYLGAISSDTTKNTIMFDHDDEIIYSSDGITSISEWKKALDDNWNTTSGKYPILYKLDKDDNPTPYLLGGQE